MKNNQAILADTLKRQEIINYDKGSIIISASAGSGKTKVLIDRLINIICNEKANVSEILAVTYTEAAAAEMKEKLRNALISEINNSSEKEKYITSQLTEINTADIFTVHSFCARLIRTYFYAVGVAPDYTIADENKCVEYRREAIDKVVKQCYEKEEEKYLNLFEKYKTKRKDEVVKNLITDIYDFCISEASFVSLFELTEGFYNNQATERLFQEVVEESKRFIHVDDRLLDELQNYFEEKGITSELEFIIQFRQKIIEVFEEPDVFKIKQIEFPKIRSLSKEYKEDVEVVTRHELLKEQRKNILAQIKKYLTDRVSDRDSELAKNVIVASQTQALFDLVMRFNQEYSLIKRDEKVLDFNDLEHFTLKILEDEIIRESVKSKYKYIFVDEYQDTNAVQEKIFSLIQSDNIFMVGDLKQSIYGFRGCRSEFFSKKFAEMQKLGKAYELSCNFRSAEKILEGVNEVFSACMTEENTGIDYTKCMLIPGGLYDDAHKGRIAIHKLPKTQEEKVEEKPRIYDVLEELKEVSFEEDSDLSDKIATIINDECKKTWYDPKEKREKLVTFSDIAILSRSIDNKKIRSMSESLIKRGIPVTSNIAENVLNFPEVIWLWETLKLCDCFYQDIPLATALKSPLGRFTDEDLLEISKFYPKKDKISERNFSSKFDYYIKNANTPLRERLKKFFDYVTWLRFYSDFASAFEVMNRIIFDSNAEGYFSASIDGENKVKRLKRFASASILGGKHLSVSAFLDYLETDNTKVLLAQNSENAVKIMTIHSSKGLQFPVVILCGLEKRFNSSDEAGELIKDRDLGIAIKFYDSQNKTIGNTIYRQKMILKKHRDMLKEETRILYVAMTRATYSLHLIYEGEKRESVPFNEARGYLDFLPKENSFIELNLENEGKILKQPRKVIIANPNPSRVEEMRKNFDYEYKYQEDTSLPLKCTVTETLKKIDISDIKNSEVIFEQEKVGKESGIVAHKFLELIDFSKRSDYLSEKDRLIKNNLMSEKDFELFDIDKIGVALNSKFFEGIENKTLLREKEFIVGIPAKMIKQTSSDTEILLQGIIDLVIIEGQTARIIDYKYSINSKETLKERYKNQLELYAYAVEKVLGLKVTEKAIFSLLAGEIIVID